MLITLGTIIRWFLSPKTNKLKNISKLFLEIKPNKFINIFLAPGSPDYVYDIILPPFVGSWHRVVDG